MASTTRTVIVPTLIGQAITASTGFGSADTVTLDFASAQGMLDPSTLMIRITNNASAATLSYSLGVGTEGSEIGQGAKSGSAIATESSVIVGGQGFESARFLTSAGTIVITFTGGAGTDDTVEAYQIPRASQ